MKATSRTYDLLREAQTKATDGSQRAGLNRIEAIEHEWYASFADRFFRHTRTLTAERSARTICWSSTPRIRAEQLKRSNEVINEVQSENRRLIEDSRTADNDASRLILLVSHLRLTARPWPWAS